MNKLQPEVSLSSNENFYTTSVFNPNNFLKSKSKTLTCRKKLPKNELAVLLKCHLLPYKPEKNKQKNTQDIQLVFIIVITHCTVYISQIG